LTGGVGREKVEEVEALPAGQLVAGLGGRGRQYFGAGHPDTGGEYGGVFDEIPAAVGRFALHIARKRKLEEGDRNP
jgi:hypothetical protein